VPVADAAAAKVEKPDAATAVPGTGAPVVRSEGGYRNGSGFLVHERGLVVTSRHVVAGAEAVEVLVPGHAPLRADLVGEDAATDLALVRLRTPPPGLPVLAFGNSEELRAGDWIVAVGNPFGLSQTVTAGVVSFVGRHLQHSDFAVTNDFLQFSAPVNPGSSGCPVLDLHGRVVGVTTQAAVSAQGISFAVPSRTVKWALDAMERSRDGRVRRGYLGIEFASRSDLDERGQRCAGAVIVRVADGQPAHRAGMRAGDVVLRIDGQAVADATVLHEHIVRGEPGSKIALQLLREGRVQDPIEAVLGEIGGPKTTQLAN
jgi:serine protease Do